MWRERTMSVKCARGRVAALRGSQWAARVARAPFAGLRACIWNAISLALSGMRTFSPIRQFVSFPRRYEWLLCYAVVPNNFVFRLFALFAVPSPRSPHCLLFWPFVVQHVYVSFQNCFNCFIRHTFQSLRWSKSVTMSLVKAIFLLNKMLAQVKGKSRFDTVMIHTVEKHSVSKERLEWKH